LSDTEHPSPRFVDLRANVSTGFPPEIEACFSVMNPVRPST
jgi:hypothetical protein